jgi:hypothetical protein
MQGSEEQPELSDAEIDETVLAAARASHRLVR